MSERPDHSAKHEGRQANMLAALSRISLPEGGTLAQSPRLGKIIMDDASGKISFSIQIAPHEAAQFEPIRQQAMVAAESVAGPANALVMLTAERGAENAPATAKAVPQLRPIAGGKAVPNLGNPKTTATATAAPKPQKPAVMPNVGRVIAVASGKGGVGKSTTTIGLALALRQEGLKVGVLDADIYGPSVPTLLGLSGKPRMAADGRRLLPMQGWGLSALSVGNLVDADTAMIWRGPMITSAITQLVGEVDWGHLDILLIDMPPGTGDAQLAVAQNSPVSGAVIVSTPQDLALIDARRGITMFRKLDLPVLGLIENMSHFICHDCGSRHEIFGHGGAEAEAAALGVPFLGAVPLTMELRRSADLGRPLVATDPDGIVGQAMSAIARNLLSQLKTLKTPPQTASLQKD